MKRFCLSALLFVAALQLVGCGSGNNPPPAAGSSNAVPASAAAAPALDPRIPTKGQSRLQTLKLWVGPKPMEAELALSSLQQETGMMFRTNMAENDGMLFVSAYPERKGFWMMNTFVPLSLAYINPEGVILEIYDLQPHNTNPVVSVSEDIQYVLETPQGWFKRNQVETGTVISTEAGPLKKAFTARR